MSQRDIREALDLEIGAVPPGTRDRILAAIPYESSRQRDPRWLAAVAAIVIGLLTIAILVGIRHAVARPDAPAHAKTGAPPPADSVSTGAYDPVHHSLVVFGSGNGGGKGSVTATWAFSEGHWARLKLSVQPEWRQVVVAAYDSTRNQAVFVMGTNNPDRRERPETWTWDGSSWQLHPDVETPLIDFNSAAVAEEPNAHALILLVQNGMTGKTQTWRWDGTRWSQLAPQHSPEIAAGMLALGFDGNRLIAAGPANHLEQGQMRSQTWAWSGTDWVRLHPATELPLAIASGLAFDGHRMLASVGSQWGGDQQTWTWDGTTWARLHPRTNPPGRTNPHLAYEPASRQLILFGGGSGLYAQSDVWRWDGSNWHLVAAGSPTPPPPPEGFGGPAKEMSADQVAAYLRAAVSASSPILVPSSVPSDMHAVVYAQKTGFSVHYFNDDSTKWLTLTISPQNLLPGGAPAVTTTRDFRGTQADYVVYDPSIPISNRSLLWTEPGTYGGPSMTGAGVPYLLVGQGLTEAEYMPVASSLVAFPTKASSQPSQPSPAAQSCGDWSAASSPTGSELTAKYGAIRNCLLVGDEWIITTAGLNGGPGSVGEYVCGIAESCVDGSRDHPPSRWVFHAAPYPGSVTFIQVRGNQILVSNGGRQVAYTMGAGTFSSGSG